MQKNDRVLKMLAYFVQKSENWVCAFCYQSWFSPKEMCIPPLPIGEGNEWETSFSPGERVFTNVEKTRVLLKKNPLGWVFSGFIGFYWVLSGFIRFFVGVLFLPDQIMVLLNFNFRFSSNYITFYAETMILTCKSTNIKKLINKHRVLY